MPHRRICPALGPVAGRGVPHFFRCADIRRQVCAAVCYGCGGVSTRRFAGQSPIKVVTAQMPAATMLVMPVSAVFPGVVFLSEGVNATAIAGMLVIGLGLAAIDGRPLQWLRRLSTA